MRTFKENRQIVRGWIRENWDTDAIIRALDEDTLPFFSCRCLVGFPSHFDGEDVMGYLGEHYREVLHHPGARTAEAAYLRLSPNWRLACDPGFHALEQTRIDGDLGRMRILRPMLKAELKRRMRLDNPLAGLVDSVQCSPGVKSIF